jgi:hypothetical protein
MIRRSGATFSQAEGVVEAVCRLYYSTTPGFGCVYHDLLSQRLAKVATP